MRTTITTTSARSSERANSALFGGLATSSTGDGSDRRNSSTMSGAARRHLRNSLTGRGGRRDSGGEMMSIDASEASELVEETLARTAPSLLFCPIPRSTRSKGKKGFPLMSKAYKNHKEKRERHHKGPGSDTSSIDEEIPLKKDLTRRKRNSFLRNGSARNRQDDATNITAYLAARIESEKPDVSHEVYNHNAALLVGMMKSHMCDLTIIGSDGVPVETSKFVLACYSPVLEEIFFKGRQCQQYIEESATLFIDFCHSSVIKAAIHHCFSGELPPDFDTERPNEELARQLAQLDHLALVYRFGAIGTGTYRAARKLINKRSVLACAIFDELSYREGSGNKVDSIKRYALDTMRDMPMDTLLAGGVQWMKDAAVEAIIKDQDMDVDEFYMFKILKSWTSAEDQIRHPIAQRLAKYIELKFIDPELLTGQVRESGFFEQRQINEAVKLISDSLANRDPSEMERVLVEGAGSDIVNGIYCRVEEEIGISEEEILFVKEDPDGYSDVGLYLWGTKWNIAMCSDYSNCFYSSADDPNKSALELVPRNTWEASYGGQDPPPKCTYVPNTTRVQRLSLSSSTAEKLAPNLEEMLDPTIAEKRRSGYFDKRTHDVAEKRTMTLEQMMNLPEDVKVAFKGELL